MRRGLGHRQEHGVSDDRRLGPDHGHLGKADRPGQFEAGEFRLRQAGLLRGERAGVAGVEAVGRHGRRRLEVDGPARALAHHRLAPGVERRGGAAGQVVDQVASALLVQRRALGLHLALGQREADHLVAHRRKGRLGRRAGLFGVVVAGGAVGAIDRLTRVRQGVVGVVGLRLRAPGQTQAQSHGRHGRQLPHARSPRYPPRRFRRPACVFEDTASRPRVHHACGLTERQAPSQMAAKSNRCSGEMP